jgi:23S rRNA U2552 (ribose-2'-O)-methylase RlmE/FtsJ
MEFEYVIVQCGGKGTRLGKYTRNRPKALVPVRNRPILFHLFAKYPKKKFIIIGDYMRDVLERYLELFADVEYISIAASGEGNAAGISDALALLPDGSPFLLLWSDLILGDAFQPELLPPGSYVGVTDRFPCSWRFQDGSLEKLPAERGGVAGCFLFPGRETLRGLPACGSFTKWLKQQPLGLLPMDMADTVEVGTLDSLRRCSDTENRCRPYNRIEMLEETVVKTGLTPEAQKLIEREIVWYERLTRYGFTGIPRILATDPLTMERIHGVNIFRADIREERKPEILRKMVETLGWMHRLERSGPNPFDLRKDCYQKTMSRMRSISAAIPFSSERSITINGKPCCNPLRCSDVFLALDTRFLAQDAAFGIIHGDCTFTNTLIDSAENLYFIDARGYFGNTPLIGDTCYDWAKIYYSVVGCFDQFNVGNFDLTIDGGGVSYQIAPSGWEQYAPVLLEAIDAQEKIDRTRLHYIHAIIWLSLASHCWEDYDSMCLAFYKGTELFQKVLDEIG